MHCSQNDLDSLSLTLLNAFISVSVGLKTSIQKQPFFSMLLSVSSLGGISLNERAWIVDVSAVE